MVAIGVIFAEQLYPGIIVKKGSIFSKEAKKIFFQIDTVRKCKKMAGQITF